MPSVHCPLKCPVGDGPNFGYSSGIAPPGRPRRRATAVLGTVVTIVYRPFRNTDPPPLLDVWNEAATGRGAFPLRTAMLLERWLFCKPYFDPASLIVAENVASKEPIGFVLCGFPPTEDLATLDKTQGIICCVMVRPSFRKQGIARELMTRAEQYLTTNGATSVRFGSQFPHNPYLFGLYGGGNSPGVLDSDPDAEPFLAKFGFAKTDEVIVYQRRLDKPLDVADGRFNLLRKRYDIQLLKVAGVSSWWQECVWGGLEPAEFRAVDKLTGLPAARATAWELEGFGWKWNAPSAGILDVQVRDDLRRMGLAKYLVTHILRFLQDQYFGIGELQVKASDEAGVGLCKSVGFDEVDRGRVYRRSSGEPRA
jgi:ribosomal protein S18 acetylase RimI-like enzyme